MRYKWLGLVLIYEVLTTYKLFKLTGALQILTGPGQGSTLKKSSDPLHRHFTVALQDLAARYIDSKLADN